MSDLLNYRIRRIDAATGVITTVAGCGRRGRGGDGGPAKEAELDITCGLATDRAGHLYLSDELACTVRRVDARTGIITRFAGIGVGGYNGDGIPALEAALYHPEHLAFDSHDQLYICDNSNDRIRRIDKRGILTTVLGDPFPASVDAQHSRSSSGDGGPAVEASIIMPDSIFVDGRDDLYVGEKYGFRIRHVDARTGIVRTVVGTGVPGFSADGEVAERTQINACEVGLWVDTDGSVLWTDCSGRLRRVDPRTRIVTTLFGGTSSATADLPAPRSSPVPPALRWRATGPSILPIPGTSGSGPSHRTAPPYGCRERRVTLRRRRRSGHRGLPRQPRFGCGGCRRQSLHRRPAPFAHPTGRPLRHHHGICGQRFCARSG